eukprot:4825537-Lingulodinium_polyedra.AAC.1
MLLHTRGTERLATIVAQRLYEQLRVARVRLVGDAPGLPMPYSVQYSELSLVTVISAQSTHELQKDPLAKLPMNPLQILVRSDNGEIVTVNDQREVTLGVD